MPTETETATAVGYIRLSQDGKSLARQRRDVEDYATEHGAELVTVEVIERDREGLEKGQPYRFFQLTTEARELFDRNNLFEPEAYRALFAEVEKSSEIEAAEAVERPTGE